MLWNWHCWLSNRRANKPAAIIPTVSSQKICIVLYSTHDWRRHGEQMRKSPPTISKLDPEIIANMENNFAAWGSADIVRWFCSNFLNADFVTAYGILSWILQNTKKRQILSLGWASKDEHPDQEIRFLTALSDVNCEFSVLWIKNYMSINFKSLIHVCIMLHYIQLH